MSGDVGEESDAQNPLHHTTVKSDSSLNPTSARFALLQLKTKIVGWLLFPKVFSFFYLPQ